MRIVIVHPADRPPLFMWNRYPSGIIGAAIRLGRHRQLSLVWARPNVNKGDWS